MSPFTLPTAVLLVILNYWPLVFEMVSRAWLKHLREQYQDQWLMQVEQVFDLTPLEQACAPYHCGSGRGSDVTHPVPYFVRVLLLKYLLGLSFRQTETELTFNLLSRAFVGYGLLGKPPDHSTLNRFEIWVLQHCSTLFFRTFLDQIEQLDPDDDHAVQLTDSYAMLARAERARNISLIRDASRKLLAALEKVDPTQTATIQAALDEPALFGQKGDKPTRALNVSERAARFQQVVTEGLHLHQLALDYLAQAAWLTPDQQAPIRHWLNILLKIIHDEATVTPADDPAEPPAVKERPHGQKGGYRIGAVSDPEATFRHHGADKGDGAKLGYNILVLTNLVYIQWLLAATGAQPDVDLLPEALAQQQAARKVCPDRVVGDQAFGTGKCRAAVEAVTDGQTQVIALVPNYDKRTDRYGPTRFTLSEDRTKLTCPHRVVSDRSRPRRGDGVEFEFTAKMCHDCPFWITPEQLAENPDLPHCRVPGCKPNSRRKVFISDYREQVLAAIKFNRTDEFKQLIKQRPQVERLIFNLTNLHGSRRAKSTGLAKAQFQGMMNATAFNIRQLLRRRSKLKVAVGPTA